MSQIRALWCGRGILCVAVALALAGGPNHCRAQVVPPKSAPIDAYWNCFGPFFDGDFRSASKMFRDVAKDGIINLSVSVPGPWIDAICYHAMIGECQYQMGNLGEALDEYSAALNLFLAHRDWLLRIEMPQEIEQELNLKTNVTWGKTARATTLGHYQPRYPSFTGRLNNAAIVRTGGIVAPPAYYPVYASEIVRCTALALSRRRELMGPLSEYDPLTGQLVEALARYGGPAAHWSACWGQLELGLAYAAANRIPQAVTELQKSLLAGGRFDHPLTCVALLELGRIAFEEGKYDAAITYCHEATISGAFFDRYDVLEEAFRLAADAHLVAGKKGAYASLAPAMGSLAKHRMLHATLCTSLAEQLTTGGELPAAAKALAQARSTIGRREMASGAIGSRLNYQTARVAMQSGDIKQGATALAAALTYQKTGSKRLFQIGLADTAFRSGGLTERVADLIFANVLREPTRVDWTTEPLETLTRLTTPHPLPFEHWFELTLGRKEQEQAVNVAERIRRRRFFLSQPLGGRLVALRWVLEGPQESLGQDAILQRQELLVKFPKYAELSRRSGELLAKLQDLPLAGGDENQAKQQGELLAELGRVSAAQEALLNMISLERVPSEFAFPPLRETKDIQQQLPDGTMVFYYFATSRNLYAFALANNRYAYFAMSQPGKIKADTSEMLRQMGHFDRTQPVAVDDLKANNWRPAAQRLLAQLTNDAKTDEWAKCRELVIVPDGMLWYVPFEALVSPYDDGSVPLLSRVPIRYAPTLSLAVPDRRGRSKIPRTAIVAGKLLPRDDETASKAAIESIAAVGGNSIVLRKEIPAPTAIFATTFDRLLVMADCDDSEKLPLAWSPLVLDGSKPGGTVTDWIQLPLAGVDQLVLPGFHTPAETGLKRAGTGDEMFQAVCGLMASGCRTIVLSRWRVGGQSTTDLMREFMHELPHQSAASAWRRSVQLAEGRWLDPAQEGRVKAAKANEGVRADHPFFWSGYMVVDTGVGSGEDAAAKAK